MLRNVLGVTRRLRESCRICLKKEIANKIIGTRPSRDKMWVTLTPPYVPPLFKNALALSICGEVTGRSSSVKTDLQAHRGFHGQQCFGIAARIVDRVMRMPRLAQMLEIDERIFDEALVERPQIR